MNWKRIAIGAGVYILISLAIFRFRHPWATEEDILQCIHHAVLLREVPISDVYPYHTPVRGWSKTPIPPEPNWIAGDMTPTRKKW